MSLDYVDTIEGMQFCDHSDQLQELVRMINLQIENGATSVGIFGSRVRNDYIPNKSDIDVFVIHPEAPQVGLYKFGKYRVNLVIAPPNIENLSENGKFLNNILPTVRWVWSRND